MANKLIKEDVEQIKNLINSSDYPRGFTGDNALINLKLVCKCFSSERINDRILWLKIMKTFKNIIDDNNKEFSISDLTLLLHEISSSSDKYDKKEVDRYLKTPSQPHQKQLSIGSLCYWAKIDNPTQYNEFIENVLSNNKNKILLYIKKATETPRKYEYSNLFDFKNKSFDDTSEVIKFLSDSVIHVVSGGDHRLFTSSLDKHDNIEFKPQVSDLFIGKNDMILFINGEKTRMRDIFMDYYAYKNYKSVDFVPYLEGYKENPCPSNTFNMFEGFTYKYSPPSEFPDYDITKLNRILYHIKEIVAGGDAYSFTWIMNWINDLFTDPAKKKGYSILLQSPEQGVGKNIIIDLIIQILGPKLYYKAMDMNSITCRFNQHLANKLLVHGDELANYSTHRDSDKLKDNITCHQRSIEPKGLEHYTIAAPERYIFTSNSELPLRVEDTDRRSACFQVLPTHLNDWSYFQKLGSDIEDTEIQRTFFLWVCHNPEWQSKDFNFGKIPNTSLRKELMKGQFDNYIDFIIEYINDSTDFKVGVPVFKSINSLYSDYKTWCDDKKNRAATFQKFCKSFKKLDLPHKRITINRIKVSGVEIEINSLELRIKNLLKDDTFKFDVADLENNNIEESPFDSEDDTFP
jgi:hypothetical protein